MTLRIYLFKNPISGDVEEVYEYPESFMGRAYLIANCLAVTKQPFEPPILMVPELYLTEARGQAISSETLYVDNKYYEYWNNQREIKESQQKFDEKLEKLQRIFGVGVFHLNNPKITFFTGPKSVFQQHFRDNIVFKDNGMLYVGDLGYFSLIKNCSVKDASALFVSGKFHSTKGETNDDTQCKITLLGG